jgi:hypothetical protein
VPDAFRKWLPKLDIDVIADKIANRLEKVSKNLGGAEIGYQW